PAFCTSALLVPDARVEPRIRDVGYEIGGDDRHRGEQEEPEENWNVSRLDRREQQLPEARPGEHSLYQDRAGYDEPGPATHDGHERQERVSQRVTHDPSLR